MGTRMTIVVKVGTGVLTKEEDASLNEAALVRLVTALADLIQEGRKVVLVSSGAVGSGVSAMNLGAYPSDLPAKQACAAIGQTRLMHIYENLFSHFGMRAAQLLLTADDFKYRAGNIKNTLCWLMERSDVIPIINENDTVAVEELKFGDNDMLSCLVAEIVNASHLFLMTSVDGLYPSTDRNGEIISVVEDAERVMEHARPGEKGKFSMGGMATKLEAVKKAVDAGIYVYIANGAYPHRISELLKGGGIGTRFLPAEKTS